MMALLTATPICSMATKYRSLAMPNAKAPLRANRARACQSSLGMLNIKGTSRATAWTDVLIRQALEALESLIPLEISNAPTALEIDVIRDRLSTSIILLLAY